MSVINFKYGKDKVSLNSTKIFVTFETKTLALYFKSKEEAKEAIERLNQLNARSTNFGKYIVTCPQYNTSINIIENEK